VNVRAKTFIWIALLAAGCQRHLEWREAPATGDVATLVRGAAETAQHDGRQLLVYVGASWCEPCERFRRAAQSGALDREFSRLRFYAFDADRDAERLANAGYSSPLIPLIVAPMADGRASHKRMFGSIKGEGAVAEMTPRLRALLAR
jgi:thiol-disulfide isomerase/thioredoxin